MGNTVKIFAKQNVQGNTGKEIVPVDQRANKQVQVGNKFAVLEVVDEEEEAVDQLVLRLNQRRFVQILALLEEVINNRETRNPHHNGSKECFMIILLLLISHVILHPKIHM